MQYATKLSSGHDPVYIDFRGSVGDKLFDVFHYQPAFGLFKNYGLITPLCQGLVYSGKVENLYKKN
jgi:hypothetical protein